MCSFFGQRTDSMKHNLSSWGTGSIGKLMFGVASTVNWEMDLGLGFGGSNFALRSGALRLGFGVLGLWSLGFRVLRFRVLNFNV